MWGKIKRCKEVFHVQDTCELQNLLPIYPFAQKCMAVYLWLQTTSEKDQTQADAMLRLTNKGKH